MFYPFLLGGLGGLGGLGLIKLLPLLMPGIPKWHDFYYHLSHLHAMNVNLHLGEFPSMINHEALCGYGYTTGHFYPNLFMYPAHLPIQCEIGMIMAYKIFIAMEILHISLSAYYCATKISGSCLGAFISAILYTWSSYLATDIFIRETFGECCFFIFMPWIILGPYEITQGAPRNFLYLSFGFAGLIYSHTLQYA